MIIRYDAGISADKRLKLVREVLLERYNKKRMNDMNIEGRKTTVERIDVEIDPLDFLKRLQSKIIPPELSYIGKDGHWYREDGYDYHKGLLDYEQDRLATQEEIKLDLAFRVLLEYIKDKKL